MTTTGYLSVTRKAIKAHLASEAVVTAITTRIKSGRARKPTLPYIRISILPAADQHGIGFHGPIGRFVRVQLDAVAKTQTGAEALMDAIMTVMDGAILTITGWGTPRFEGYYGPYSNEEIDKDVSHWRCLKRWKAVYSGQQVT